MALGERLVGRRLRDRERGEQLDGVVVVDRERLAELLELIEKWSSEDPAYDRETLPLLLAEPDPVFERVLYRNCQDAWVFRVPVPVLPRSDFAVGNCPGCDNAIAFRAAEAGLIPINVAGTFPIWDLLFGTFYMPEHELPDAYGIADKDFPQGFAAQMLYPFMR